MWKREGLEGASCWLCRCREGPPDTELTLPGASSRTSPTDPSILAQDPVLDV